MSYLKLQPKQRNVLVGWSCASKVPPTFLPSAQKCLGKKADGEALAQSPLATSPEEQLLSEYVLAKTAAAFLTL